MIVVTFLSDRKDKIKNKVYVLTIIIWTIRIHKFFIISLVEFSIMYVDRKFKNPKLCCNYKAEQVIVD